ncbi:MAG TPA: hypothetical protein VG674_02465 [Amycolatopsis sp.]|jgi:hypothetical protein|nr:hypothetical protein [Amycolatopsis sp.]
MKESVGSPPSGKPVAVAPRKRLSGPARKAWLVTHIVSVSAWIGIDVVLAVLVFTALATDDRMVAATCYQALQLFAVWPLLAAGLVCLISGVVLGWGSKYGVVRYWWVVVKLGLNLLLTTLGVLALRPAVNEAVDYGRALVSGGPATGVPDLIFPPIVSPACLLLAVVLSVYKPWGRVKKA